MSDKKAISRRQGDWTIIPYEGKLMGEKIKHTNRKFVFAEGEATGHYHTAVLPSKEDMQFYKQKEGWIAEFKKDAVFTHPEHSQVTDIEIPSGTYRIFRRKEKDWFSGAVRKVQD